MFKYILKKEFKLIFRDIHALLVLFIMPALFILIMSIALKNTYSETNDSKQTVAIISSENKDISKLIKSINKAANFQTTLVKNSDIKNLVYIKNYDFIIKIPSNFKKLINKNSKEFKIEIYSKPDASIQNYTIFKNLIVENISKDIMKDYLIKYKINAKTLSNLDKHIEKKYVYKSEKDQTKPTSTQQSVPSWLVFSMFFILIPISNTFINEKNFGTISRIKTINVPFYKILLGKILPYFCINQIQVFIMILIGIFLVPLFGGDALVINGNYFLIFCITSVISLSAISFGLFIANIAKTTEEATSIGGVINILFAALGGIMVPKFVMPEFMQEVTNLSPMSWGLESLVEVFVRNGSFIDIKYYLLYLMIFAIVFISIAYILLIKKEIK